MLVLFTRRLDAAVLQQLVDPLNPTSSEEDEGWPTQRNTMWWASAAILLVWTKKKPKNQLPPLCERQRKTGIAKAGDGSGYTPHAMGKAAWKKRLVASQCILPLGYQQLPPWIKPVGYQNL